MHVFEAASFGELVPHRAYTPRLATLADYRGMMAMTGIERAVLVQPSVFGTDHTALLRTLSDAPFLRGIAVLPPEVPGDALKAFDDAGVRGIRVNRRNPGGLSLDALRLLGPRIAPLGWHIETQIQLDETAGLRAIVEQLAVPVVIDHFGLPDVMLGPDGPGFRTLLDLMQAGNVWVKLSAPGRVSRHSFPHPDVTPLVEALVSTRPDRLLWASDWPHVDLRREMPDDAALVDLIAEWVPDAVILQQILVDNPSALYFRR